MFNSEYRLPIKRFTEYKVFLGLVTATRLAAAPIFTSPLSKEITYGVVLAPSPFTITTDSPPSITEIHELVVPKSIPIILLILFFKLKCIVLPF